MHAQRKFWQLHGRLFLCWSYYCVYDNTQINLENTQIIHCILCYQDHVIGINSRTQARTNFLLQYKWNNFFKKTCEYKAHCYWKNVWKKSEVFAEKKKRKTTNKKTIMSGGSIFIFFGSKIISKKRMCHKKIF